VDVLAARQNLVAAQTAYSRSRYDYMLNVLRLKQAAGILDRKALEDMNGWLETPPPPANPPTVDPAQRSHAARPPVASHDDEPAAPVRRGLPSPVDDSIEARFQDLQRADQFVEFVNREFDRVALRGDRLDADRLPLFQPQPDCTDAISTTSSFFDISPTSRLQGSNGSRNSMSRLTAPRLASIALRPFAPMPVRAAGSANRSPMAAASVGASLTMRTAPLRPAAARCPPN
jgi:hypothetical protein